MASEMYPVILEEMSQILKVSKGKLEGDIRDITEYWETCLGKADIKDRGTAIFILTTCITCYLRGRGIRLENNRSLNKNSGILVSLVTLIPLFAWSKPPQNYPRIHELIPIASEQSRTSNQRKDILAQAEEILKAKWQE